MARARPRVGVGSALRSVLAIAGPLASGVWTGDLVSAVLVSVGGIAGMLGDRDGSLRERAALVVPATVAAAGGAAAGMVAATFGWSGRLGILVIAAGLSALLTVRRPAWSIVALNLLVFTSLGTGAAELTTASPWFAAACLALGGGLILAVPDIAAPVRTEVGPIRQVGAWLPLGLVLCIAAASALGELLHLEQAHWVPLTVAFIYKPDLGRNPGRSDRRRTTRHRHRRRDRARRNHSCSSRNPETEGTTMTTQRTYASVGGRFLAQADLAGDREAFRAPSPDGGWTSLSWADTARRATDLAAGLLALGVRPAERVAIAGTTRLEWVLADLAVALAGAATTTVYPSTNAEDVDYILTDCCAVVVFAEDTEQLAKIRSAEGFVGSVRHVVLFDGAGAGEEVLSWDGLAALGQAYLREHPGPVRDAVAAVTPDHLATIVYTSGTTGRPKGVELTHANWLYLASAIASEGVVRPDHLQFLWLPLSHVFGRLLLAAQYEIGFVTAIDGRIDRIVDNLAVIRPSFMAAAPRIFEKIYSRVVSTVEAEGGLKRRLFDGAFRLGIDAVRLRAAGKPVPRWQAALLAGADKVVFAKIRARLGGNLEYLVSGSAALSPQIAEWFAAAGLPILEGYGLTETTGASFVNRPGDVCIGTVGQPFPGTEVRIAEDGEILLCGPGIMRGYHGLPEQTAAVIDSAGWFATGDIGELDDRGFLKITDRKKDLVKTSGGKYIAPTAIESAVKAACPLVSNAVVIADGRNFASLLVTVDPNATKDWAPEAMTAAIEAAITRVNAGLNRWETIKQFRVLPGELSVESGELTPSLKIKRAVVVKNYADLIESIYSEPLSR